jgi:hypothetical protein
MRETSVPALLKLRLKTGLNCLMFMCLQLSLLSNQALAIPGQTEVEVKDWLAKHTFLMGDTPYPDPARPGVWGVGRPLSLGRMIIFEIWLGRDGRVMGENTYVHVPLQTEDPLNLFDRQNLSTYQLLNLIYGAEIAQDFKQARFIYDGFKYYEGNPRSTKSKRLAIPTRKSFFLGQRFSYMASLLPASKDAKEYVWYLSVTSPRMAQSTIAALEQEKQFLQKHQTQAERETEKKRQAQENQKLLLRRTQSPNLDDPPSR